MLFCGKNIVLPKERRGLLSEYNTLLAWFSETKESDISMLFFLKEWHITPESMEKQFALLWYVTQEQ